MGQEPDYNVWRESKYPKAIKIPKGRSSGKFYLWIYMQTIWEQYLVLAIT